MTAIWNGTRNTRFFKNQVFTFIWVGKKKPNLKTKECFFACTKSKFDFFLHILLQFGYVFFMKFCLFYFYLGYSIIKSLLIIHSVLLFGYFYYYYKTELFGSIDVKYCIWYCYIKWVLLILWTHVQILSEQLLIGQYVNKKFSTNVNCLHFKWTKNFVHPSC